MTNFFGCGTEPSKMDEDKPFANLSEAPSPPCPAVFRPSLHPLVFSFETQKIQKLTFLLQVLEEGKEPGPFWDALGGKGPIMKASDVEDDEAFERQQEKDVKLYHVTDADGTLRVRPLSLPSSGLSPEEVTQPRQLRPGRVTHPPAPNLGP